MPALALPGFCKQQVGRLDVAVDQAHIMGVMQPGGSLADDLTGQADRDRIALADELVEVGPVDVFHDQIMPALDLVGVEGGDDVGVMQLGGGANLALEHLHGLGRLHELRRQHLDGHDALHRHVHGLVDPAHAALPQLVENLVLAQKEAAASGR